MSFLNSSYFRLARGKIDGAWGFWQHRCSSRWQLLASEEEEAPEDEEAARRQRREQRRRGSSSSALKLLPKERRVGWRTPAAPAYIRRRRLFFCLLLSSSVLLPEATLVSSRAQTAPCDAFGAPCLVIRVIYAALIAPRRTITAVRAGRSSRADFRPHSSL